MTDLVVRAVTKSYGATPALRGVDLDVGSAGFTAILGPSGCGKTTLLRCIAGFERPDAGEILADGQVVAGTSVHVPAHRRRIAVVPQEGALFPHLSVAANVGYGLTREQRRTARVDEVLELVGLAGYGRRWPHELSGGQQQRVAVARALAPRPRLVLLDEPFSALDAALRVELRRDIRAALLAAGATVVLVTHDQDEALSTADQVAVMRDGVVVQVGAPVEVYRAPNSEWVARFVGDAVALPAVADGDTAATGLGRVELTSHPVAERFTVVVRPEQIRLGGGPATATVVEVAFHGHDLLVALRLADATVVTARVPATTPVEPGSELAVGVRGVALAQVAES
ncbi:ABC transporter ATP-binding protein [Actinokineospora guangxiensis]|uniref:ABC transporter ATP-binding protein n=1 Tax=Actinokineospora guangxiensis TaxID=1490288 RepID=A0ABW0EYB7_9PSEU